MYADPVLFQNKSVAVRLICDLFLPDIYFIFRHVSNGKTRGNKMSNSTSQNRQVKIKKKGSFTRNLPLYLLMIHGLLNLIINNSAIHFAIIWHLSYSVRFWQSLWRFSLSRYARKCCVFIRRAFWFRIFCPLRLSAIWHLRFSARITVLSTIQS